MRHKRMMRVIEIYISKTISMERFSDEKVFVKDIVVSGSIEDLPLKKKLTLEKIIFSLTFVFLKKFWFVWYHYSMSVHTNEQWWYKEKKVSEKKFSQNIFSIKSFE